MIPLEEWPPRLERALAEGRVIRRATVLRETESTQDAAQRLGAIPGELITAWRQTAGRGRLGRRWLDTMDEGVACSFVVERGAAAMLTSVAAVAACRALRSIVSSAAHVGSGNGASVADGIGIKWPNDIVAPDGSKLCGILVECSGNAAIIGIGVNVRQREFDLGIGCEPAPDRARSADLGAARPPTSLALLGIDIDRIEVIEELARRMEEAFGESESSLRKSYRELDRLRGSVHRFRSGGRIVEGMVLEVDPAIGIRVQSGPNPEILPASITTLAVAPGVARPT